MLGLLILMAAACAAPLVGLRAETTLAAGALALGAFTVYRTGNRVSRRQLWQLGFMFAAVQLMLPEVVAESPGLAPVRMVATWALGIGALCSALHSVLVLHAARDRAHSAGES